MPPVSDYYDDVRDEPAVIEKPEETSDVLDDPARLAELLDQPDEDARRVLRLLDGMEAFPEPPPFPEVEPLLPDPALEGFSDMLSDLWDRIKRWLRKLRQWILDDGRLVHEALRAVKFQAENLKVDGRARITSRSGQLEMRSHIAALSVFYKPPRDVGAVISSLRHLESVLATYLDYVDRHLLSGVNRIGPRVNQINPTTMIPSDLADLTQSLRQFSPEQLITPLRLAPLRGQATQLAGAHLLGNHRLVLIRGGDENTLEGITRQQLRLRFSELRPRPVPSVIQLPRFNRVQHDQSMNQVIALADLLMLHTQSSMRRQRERMLDSLSAYVEAFTIKTEGVDSSRLQRKEQIRLVVQTARTVSDWANNPYHGMISNALRSMRGTLVLCRANMDK